MQFRSIFLVCFLLLSPYLSAVAADYWPTDDWKTDTHFQKGHTTALSALDAILFPSGSKLQTDGAVVIKDGYVIYERYANDYTATSPHLTWSASKSVLNALVGIGIRDGRLTLHSSICDYLPEMVGKPQCTITVSDLLQWSSGLQWAEDYESTQTPKNSSVLAMLYGAGHLDMSHFVVNHPVQEAPGKFWEYSSGDSVLLSRVVANAYPDRDFSAFPWNEIFLPLGMKNVVWERDAKGTFVGSSYLYASPREFAKFGFLYLNHGHWDKSQIVPSSWIDYSLATGESYTLRAKDLGLDNESGAHWWTNHPVAALGGKQPWPGLPEDTFAAEGHWGQIMMVIPSWNMIVVRTANDRAGSLDFGVLANGLRQLEGLPAVAVTPYVSAPDLHGKKTVPGPYDNSLIDLSLGFAAKEMCSCLYVSGRSEKDCRDYVSIPQLTPRLRNYRKTKTVTSRFLLVFHRTAIYESDRFGCRLQ